MTPLQALHNLLPMNVASLSFVYVYLPICSLVYYILPKRFRVAALLVFSLAFYALAVAAYFWLICFVVLADFALIQVLTHLKTRVRRLVLLWLCVLSNLALVGYFAVMAQLERLMQPFGLFVVCISGISAAIEAYHEEPPQSKNFAHLALYITFFPRLYAGPLVSQNEFVAGMSKADFDLSGITLGFGRFVQGLIKYAVIGRSLFFLYNSIRLIPLDETTVLSAWALVLSFALSLYYTLSGLTDIARGIAGLFGLNLPQNFYYPYQSRSVTDFFERFNITVGVFLKREVAAPLTSEKRDVAGDMLNILLVGMLWGIWFGLRTNYVVWGAFISAFIIMEKYLYPRILKALPTLFCRAYALCVALVGFTIFAGESLRESFDYFVRMFSFNAGEFFNPRILYVLSSNFALIIVSILFATNIFSLIGDFFRKSLPRVSLVTYAAIDLIILVAFTAVTLGGNLL